MRIGPLITLLSSTYGLAEAGITLVARALREAGWLSTGARGVNAPEMGARDVARLTLALLSGEPPSKVVDEFALLRTLQTADPFPLDGFLSPVQLPVDHTLEDVITALFAASFDETHIQRFVQDDLFDGYIWPSFSVSVDASRRTAEVHIPGFTAEYSDRKGEEELDALYEARITTLDQLERAKDLEARAATPGSSKVIANRGMRVVRTISEVEFKTIAAAMRGPP
jgi:hypothetical protein